MKLLEYIIKKKNKHKILSKILSKIFKRLKIKWNKCDELDALIRGVQFLNQLNSNNECFYFDIETHNNENVFIKKKFLLNDNLYPYIIVNIGSGVSILLVNSENSYKRISGTRYFLFYFKNFTFNFNFLTKVSVEVHSSVYVVY